MDANAILVLVVAILAIVAIAGFLRYRASASADISGPKGTGLRFRGSDERHVPTLGEDIRAGKDVAVTDTGGLGAQGRRIDAQGSVNISHQRSEPQPPPASPDPKG